MLIIPPQKLKELLANEGLITASDFEVLSEEARRLGQNLGELLISRGIITPDYLYGIISKYFGVERAGFANRKINEEILSRLSENLARQKRAVLFDKDSAGVISAAMEDPSDLNTIEFLQKHLGARIKPFLAAPEDLNKGFSFYGRHFAEDFKKIIEENIAASLRQKASQTIEEAAAAMPIIAIIDGFFSYAVSLRASDIHIEIFEDGILTRFRIDGILHEIMRIPKEVHPPIIARLKILAGLKIDEHQKPQDGRFRYKIGSDLVDIRVSIIPTFYGEKTEMRLLPSTQKPLSLKDLGIMESSEIIIRENIKKSYGMILVTGPTGSGKTTTLYALLNILNKPEVNIITVEDPIEYDMKYVNQIQINPLAGITFASGLRSILRQDPNIIMVGEIRDNETAEISVHAALTGHLVLSTLHTNDAPTAVPRLIDMKIAPFLAAAVLNMIMAQRLVRKICLNCIESFPPSSDLVESIKGQLKELRLTVDLKTPKILYKGHGCSSCNHTGYSGRIGIYEILDINDDIRKEIINPEFSLDNLVKLAKQKGMITMFEDGLRKAELGMTTIDEVLRVIRE
ncbi:type II/IV secretion system protein [Candidatus Wolfebacteria bacterium]|nr:type II/IV secretion system protein [Candidatus Wolfebacteria bacterium]